MTNFIPDKLEIAIAQVPFFEDSSLEGVPGRRTEKSISKLQSEVSGMLTKLGAFNIRFIPGMFAGRPSRYGFAVHFQFANAVGRMDCAALPMRNETTNKKDRAMAQALYLLRNKLEAQVWAMVYEPGSVPLVPYLIGPGGKTVTEYMVESGKLPMLMGG